MLVMAKTQIDRTSREGSELLSDPTRQRRHSVMQHRGSSQKPTLFEHPGEDTVKRPRHVYSYSPASGVETHAVIEHRRDWIVIQSRAQSIFTMLLPKFELDAGRYYYTTRERAVEAFIAKAEAALADKARAKSRDGWKDALRDAQKFLSQKPRARTSQEQEKQVSPGALPHRSAVRDREHAGDSRTG
jgi:hypothetical protein